MCIARVREDLGVSVCLLYQNEKSPWKGLSVQMRGGLLDDAHLVGLYGESAKG